LDVELLGGSYLLRRQDPIDFRICTQVPTISVIFSRWQRVGNLGISDYLEPFL